MGGYSFGRVMRLAVKHYADHSRRYAVLYSMMAFIPMLFAILSSDIDAASGMSIFMFLVGAFAVVPLTMNELRRSGTKIIVNTLPVSTAERMTFIILNTSVIYSIMAALCGVVGTALVSPLVEGDVHAALAGLLDDCYGRWEIHVMMWIIASGGVVVNAFARKRLIESYLLAFVAMTLLLWGFSRTVISIGVNIEWHDCYEWIAKAIYCSIPVVLYAAAFFIMRRRQIKW